MIRTNDPYTKSAMRFWGLEESEVTPAIRQFTKRIIYAKLYGSSWKLIRNIDRKIKWVPLTFPKQDIT